MYLIVNNQELTVNNAYTERDINTNVLSAVIEVPYSVDFVMFKTLFMENTGIITKVNDDGSTESWDGFTYERPPVDDGEQYRIVLAGNENTYQIERLRHLEQVLIENKSKLSSMEYTLTEKDNIISEKESKIVEQKEMIVAKDTLIAEQSITIAEKETTIAELQQTLEVKNLELVSKEEEIVNLAEQCADLLYMSSLKEIETIENEVIAE